jgi:hypothetical protein
MLRLIGVFVLSHETYSRIFITFVGMLDLRHEAHNGIFVTLVGDVGRFRIRIVLVLRIEVRKLSPALSLCVAVTFVLKYYSELQPSQLIFVY